MCMCANVFISVDVHALCVRCNRYLWPVIAGVLLILSEYILGTQDYLGIGRVRA